MSETWDLESVYDAEINPLMTRIIAICKEHEIPMLATFAYREDGDVTSFCTTALSFLGREVPEIQAASRAICRSNGMLAITIGPSGGGTTP